MSGWRSISVASALVAVACGCNQGRTVHSLPRGSTRCPTGIGPVSPTDADSAYRAVLRYEKATPAQLIRVSVATADRAGGRGADVGLGCGRVVATRTFVVEARRTNVGTSASLADSATYVSHRGPNWFVWAEVH